MEALDERTPLEQTTAAVRAWLPTGGLAAFTGAWGMVTGFALFIVVEDELEQWWVPVVAVLLATLAAAIVEWLRARAEGRHLGRLTIPGALAFLVILTTFELFVYAFHDLAMSTEHWREVLDKIFGVTSASGVLNLLAFVILWVVLAARLASALSSAVLRMPDEISRAQLIADHGASLLDQMEATQRRVLTRESLRIGLKAGLRTGFITIPILVLGYAVLLRLGVATIEYWFGGAKEWPLDESWLEYLVALSIIGVISEAISHRKIGMAGFLVVYFGIWVFRWHVEAPEAITKFGKQLWATILLSIDIGIVWAGPTIVLAVLAPFLRRPSQYPWLWSPLAFVTGLAALVAVVVARQPAMLTIAGILIAAGFVLRLRERIDDLWPLLAASVATLGFLTAVLILQLSPLAMYRNIRAVVIPPGIAEQELSWVSPKLTEIETITDPEERRQSYDKLLKSIGDLVREKGMSSFWDKGALTKYVREQRDLEEATLAREAPPSISRSTTFGLCTISALSFWLTLGLLAVWRARPQSVDRLGL